MIVVSDSSILIGLSRINSLELLRKLYGEVLIPEAVFREVTISATHSGKPEIVMAAWMEVRTVSNRSDVEQLMDKFWAG